MMSLASISEDHCSTSSLSTTSTSTMSLQDTTQPFKSEEIYLDVPSLTKDSLLVNSSYTDQPNELDHTMGFSDTLDHAKRLPNDTDHPMTLSVPIPTHKGEQLVRRGSFVLDVYDRAASDIGRRLELSRNHKKGRPFYNACIDFLANTTVHGVPMLLYATRTLTKMMWILLSIVSLTLFVYAVVLVVDKFNKKEKIVNVELEFESAPFPAITICNLNPFKKHLARSVPEVSDTLDAFHQAVTYGNDAKNEEASERTKRSANRQGRDLYPYVQYEPVYSGCECTRGEEKECIGKDTVPPSEREACICNFDRQDGSAWPCYSARSWRENICPECNDIGFCNVPNTTGTDSIPCFCQLAMGYCLLKGESRIRRVWEFRGKKVPEKNSPFRKDFLEQLKKLGYDNVTDQVAITTQAKEKLVLRMSSLNPSRRAALGYGKMELIRMCSFNGKQCHIEKEFRLHIDSSFGNCYTFNYANTTKASSRAGPNNGLRLMVFVNTSDYLPTTEATGVRITIHGQNECPFPDTFGYSAPTGAISSFGISLRKVNRLPKPHGDCFDSNGPLPSGYIYKNYKYEPEGCYRTCYQRKIIRMCGCADPRFPPPNNRIDICDTRNDTIRECILYEGARFSSKKISCRCVHPCQQDVFTTTYSAAKWPSGSIKMECDNKAEDCNRYFHEHAAMVEIYYEQMSYEVLKESESYLFVNMMSDIGGQAGLFLGASILTAGEFIGFALRMLFIAFKKCCSRSPKKIIDDETDSVLEKHLGDDGRFDTA